MICYMQRHKVDVSDLTYFIRKVVAGWIRLGRKEKRGRRCQNESPKGGNFWFQAVGFGQSSTNEHRCSPSYLLRVDVERRTQRLSCLTLGLFGRVWKASKIEFEESTTTRNHLCAHALLWDGILVVGIDWQEKQFNPYYFHLASTFCGYDHSHRVTLQYSFWDKWKVLPSMSPRGISNLALLLAHLVASNSMSLTTLKVSKR